MEDMFAIAALACGDYNPWTCVRCECINFGDTKQCEVCDEIKYGHTFDVECECPECQGIERE